MKSVAFHTLGCKLNFSETSALSRLMENDGFERKEWDEIADVYVLNTCSVTENADKECRQIVRRIRRQSPDSMVVVTGCYAQLKPDEIAGMDGVDLVLGQNEKFNISQHVKELTKGVAGKVHSCEVDEIQGFHGAFSYGDRTRAFLKVQDGCDYTCTYCTIPQARGKSRSNSILGVRKDLDHLQEKGIQEVVLTGVNLGDFGKGDVGGKKHEESFIELIRDIDEYSTIPRFRISSCEPNLLTPEIIDFVAGSKRFMPHFHIPLQSGSNEILAKMRRRYQRELYAERVEMIKKVMPHCCIGVDVIVGFPGETDDLFMETFYFLRELDVSYFHVFTYSERPGTLAADMEDAVPKNVRQERNRLLRNLSYQKMRYFTEQHLGEERPVLFETARKKDKMEGYTDNYIRIEAPFYDKFINKIVDWKVG